jgi:hypothetical protein
VKVAAPGAGSIALVDAGGSVAPTLQPHPRTNCGRVGKVTWMLALCEKHPSNPLGAVATGVGHPLKRAKRVHQRWQMPFDDRRLRVSST